MGRVGVRMARIYWKASGQKCLASASSSRVMGCQSKTGHESAAVAVWFVLAFVRHSPHGRGMPRAISWAVLLPICRAAAISRKVRPDRRKSRAFSRITLDAALLSGAATFILRSMQKPPAWAVGVCGGWFTVALASHAGQSRVLRPDCDPPYGAAPRWGIIARPALGLAPCRCQIVRRRASMRRG